MISSGRELKDCCIASTVLRPICATVPRQPACATAHTPWRSSAKSSGTQSAKNSSSGTFARFVTKASVSLIVSASAVAPAPTKASSTTATLLPCTCSQVVNFDASKPRACANRRRFCSTSSTSSPTCKARFKVPGTMSLSPCRRQLQALPKPACVKRGNIPHQILFFCVMIKSCIKTAPFISNTKRDG